MMGRGYLVKATQILAGSSPATPAVQTGRRRAALFGGMAIALGLAAVDFAGAGETLIIGTVVLGPFVAAVLGGPGRPRQSPWWPWACAS